jgi:hypothetical protein
VRATRRPDAPARGLANATHSGKRSRHPRREPTDAPADGATAFLVAWPPVRHRGPSQSPGEPRRPPRMSPNRDALSGDPAAFFAPRSYGPQASRGGMSGGGLRATANSARRSAIGSGRRRGSGAGPSAHRARSGHRRLPRPRGDLVLISIAGARPTSAAGRVAEVRPIGRRTSWIRQNGMLHSPYAEQMEAGPCR